MIIGSNIIYREKVSSTNELAAEMLKDNSPSEGTVIFAGEQLHGKGQRGNKWISEAGKNLTFSIILYPDFLQSDQQFMISKVISISILELLDKYSDSISIKWPNDIYHKDDKIAGILIEYSLEGNKIQHCIAGAGININQFNFPPDIPNPVSLNIINHQEYDTGIILAEFCRICDYWYKELVDGQVETINTQYHNNLYRLNINTGFITHEGPLKGRITGVDTFGRILIDHENGNKGIYGFREIEFNN
ncbi:MAG TPA: biotin--[acetyl-CoA-carboxylase] ligase [Bacteroidales bacterium]|nr:biotin--[acetyl-CoA-carboxylase] ligase [Bacteroidales bacterium]